MTTFSLKYENILEGPSNFVPCKCRVHELLEKHGLQDFVETEIVEPINPMQLAKYKKKMAKTKQVILDKKTTDKEMFDALVTPFQSENINQKMLLRNNPRASWMSVRIRTVKQNKSVF
jgi:hypothetical protein